MKTKTKRSAVVSAILLLVSVCMLIGSTFAWFSDNVASKNNLIQTGNLDVALYYAPTYQDAEEEKWTEVTESTEIFGYDLWEPGHVKTAWFKVVNEGSLALKYQLSLDVYSETAGVNREGETFLLSDCMKTAVIEPNADRDEILAGEGAKLKDSFVIDTQAQVLYSEEEANQNKPTEEIVGLAVWMPADVGNKTNHNGEDIPSVELGINLLATQYTYEMDSFGTDYDTDADYPLPPLGTEVNTAEELAAALAAGEDCVLMEDLTVSETGFVVPEGTEATLYMNGKTIDGTFDIRTKGNKVLFEIKGDLTVKGEGTITMNTTGLDMEWEAMSCTLYVNGGDLTVDGTTVRNTGGTRMAYAIDTNPWNPDTNEVLDVVLNEAEIEAHYFGIRVRDNGPAWVKLTATDSQIDEIWYQEYAEAGGNYDTLVEVILNNTPADTTYVNDGVLTVH